MRITYNILKLHFNWIKKYKPKSKFRFKKKNYLLILKMKKASQLLEKRIQRQNAILDGAYDGRYRKRVVPNKKKKLSKEWARIKVKGD